MGGSSGDRLMCLVKLLQRTMTDTESELGGKIYLQLMVSCNRGKVNNLLDHVIKGHVTVQKAFNRSICWISPPEQNNALTVT